MAAQQLEIFYKSLNAVGNECTAQQDILPNTQTGSQTNSYIIWYDDQNPAFPTPLPTVNVSVLAQYGVTIHVDAGLSPFGLSSGFFADAPFDGTQPTDTNYYEYDSISGDWISSGTCAASSGVNGSVGFSLSASSITEGVSGPKIANIPVVLTGATSFPVTLSFTFNQSLGTAELADITVLTSTLTFSADGTQIATVQVNNDAGSNNETAVFEISETTSTGVTITTSQHTLTVIDYQGLVSTNGNAKIEVYYKNDNTVNLNGGDICAGSQDALYGTNGTLADSGSIQDTFILYYDINFGLGLSLSDLSQQGVNVFIDDAVNGIFQEPPQDGYVSSNPFDGSQVGTFTNYKMSSGVITQNTSTCTGTGTANPTTRSIAVFFTPADTGNLTNQYCEAKQRSYIFYESSSVFNTIEELLWEVSYNSLNMKVMLWNGCNAPNPLSVQDITSYPGMMQLEPGFYGDDLYEHYLYDPNETIKWRQSKISNQDYNGTNPVPNQDPSVSLTQWEPWVCDPLPTSATELNVFYNTTPNDFCLSATLNTVYYYAGGNTYTLEELIALGIPIFQDLDSAVDYFYCPQTSTGGFANFGLYGSTPSSYRIWDPVSKSWLGSGNCVLTKPIPRPIDVNLSGCNSVTGNEYLSICQYPTVETTLYYYAGVDLTLLEIVQYNMYLYTSEGAALTSDYNHLVGGGSPVGIRRAGQDTSIGSNEYVIFTGSYYLGENISGSVINTIGASPSNPKVDLVSGRECDTIARPSVTESEGLSDGGYNIFYAFYACNPKQTTQNPSVPFGAYNIYVIDGLHRVGETSPISDFIDTMKIAGKTVFSNDVCSCLEYIHTIESEDLGSAKSLLENYYPNVIDVNPGDIGISSGGTTNMFASCANCQTSTNPTSYQFGTFEEPSPIVPGPNMDIEKNYKLDNVSKPLLRTNPKLSTNVKLVVDSGDRIYLDSFNANQNLADSKYKKYELSSDSRYSYDLSRYYSDNNTPIDSTFEILREYSDYSVLDQYRKQLEEEYQYGTKINTSKLYSEDFRILAPIWLDVNVPKKFVIYRAADPNPDVVLDDTASGKQERILKLVKNSKIVKVFDLSKQSNIGKYLRSHIQDEFFPDAPITVTMEKDEKSSFNGIDLIKGGFVEKGEYLYEDFVRADQSMIDANDFITDGFRRNKVACANLINLEFMFDDPEADLYSVNRYYGLYVDDFETGVGEVSYVQDGIVKFKSIESYMGGGNPTFAIPEHRLLRDTGLLTFAKIKDDFFTLDPTKTYDAIRSNVSINATNEEIESRLGIFTKGVSTSIIKNDAADSDFIKFRIINTPATNDSIKVSMIKKESVRLKIVKNTSGDTITITDFLGNEISFSAGSTANDTWNNLSSKWNDIETHVNGGTINPVPSVDEIAFYNRYKLNLEITNQINSVVFTERYSGLVDNEITVSSNGSTIIAIDEIYTNVDPSLGTFFADGNGTLAKKKFSSNSFSALGTFSDIAFAIAGAINYNSDFEAYSVDDYVYVKSVVKGYNLKNAVLLIGSFNTSQFIEASNYDLSNSLELNQDVLALYNAYYFTGGHSGGKSVRVPADSVDVISVGDFLPTKYNGVFNNIIHIAEDTTTRDGGYKLILKDKNELTDAVYDIYSNNRITLGLFSAYDIYDMDFDFYDKSNSDIKELALETRENMNYVPYEYGVEQQSAIIPADTLSPDNIIDSSFIEDPSTYFANLLPRLEVENPTANTPVTIESEYDRLNENAVKEYSTNSRVVPTINKWILKDSLTVREEPYHLNTNEAFGRTNFSPDVTKEGRDEKSFTHEWFYIDNWPSYFKPELVNVTSISNYKDDYNKGISYVNFVHDFVITRDLFTSTQYDYFDRFMVAEGFETIADINDGTQILSPIFWAKTVLRKKYSLISGGSEVEFGNSMFKGLKFTFKKRKGNESILASEFVKNAEFNGYRFSVLAKTSTSGGSNSVNYEFIKNDVFKFLILVIDINIDDSFVNYINRKYLYELNHKIIYSPDQSGNDAYAYSDVLIDGAIDVTNIQFSGPGPYLARGIEDQNGVTTRFEQQVAPGEDETYGSILINYTQSLTPNGEDVYLDVLAVYGDDILQIAGPPYYIDSNTQQKVNLNASSIPLNLQKSATYTYIGGGVNAYAVLFEQLSAKYFYDTIKNDPGKITYTTVNSDGSESQNLFSVDVEDGKEIIKESVLYSTPDTDTPKTFKLTKKTIGYTIENDSPYYPFLIRHSGKYTIDLTPVVTFTDVYSFNKVIRNQRDYEAVQRALKEPYYKLNLISSYETQKSIAFYKKFNRLGVAFNVGFVTDGGTHDNDWGSIKNHFYHKVNEINTLGVTKLSESSEYLPQYPLINEIAIDKIDMNVFKSSWEEGYYVRSIAGGLFEMVPGTISTLEEKSYLGSSAVKYRPSYSIYQFTSSNVQSESELDQILKNSNNTTDVVVFEDDTNVYADFYMDNLIARMIGEDGLHDTIKKFVDPTKSAGDKTTIEDDVILYALDNVVGLYGIDEIRLYVKKYKGIQSEVISTGSIDAIDNGGYESDQSFTYKLHGQKSLNFRLIYNKKLGYSYNIRALIKIQA